MRNWKTWAKFALIRAIKTVAQTAVAMLPAAAMIHEVDWIGGIVHGSVGGCRVALHVAGGYSGGEVDANRLTPKNNVGIRGGKTSPLSLG